MVNPATDNPYTEPGSWIRQESGRLRHMDDLLCGVTTADLTRIAKDIPAATDGRIPNLIDIGAGPSSTVEDWCRSVGIDYWALDVSPTFLKARPNTSHKVVGRSEVLPFKDGSFDIAYSRAVTAWNKTPERAIAEQLRVTALGGVAIFTEYDWSSAGIDPKYSIGVKFMMAKTTMMRALAELGFRPEYGGRIDEDIDLVAEDEGIICERQETRHELPAGDYRELFSEAATNIREQLKQVRVHAASAKRLAIILEGSVRAVQETTDPLEFKLPALVTQVVRISGVIVPPRTTVG